jgi:hypothetical protein
MDICIIPRSLTRHVAASDQDAIHLNSIFSAVLVSVVFMSSPMLRFVTELPHYCLLEHLFGVPCPGCEITTALVQLAHFHIEESISSHPAAVVLLLTVLFQVVARSVALFRLISFSATQRLVTLASHIFFGFLILHWLITLFNHH